MPRPKAPPLKRAPAPPAPLGPAAVKATKAARALSAVIDGDSLPALALDVERAKPGADRFEALHVMGLAVLQRAGQESTNAGDLDARPAYYFRRIARALRFVAAALDEAKPARPRAAPAGGAR
ncbi:MAG TPA: hypothetical protein VFS43_13295 [Polyangiaceae bacterium]|nr:hypothetical protein [Polyangiaceae bacterium]